MPSFRLRTKHLKAPFNTAKILTKYSQVDLNIMKDDLCRIEDNSDPRKWQVLSLDKNRHAEVPSVCFVIKGPDADLVDLVEKLRFKYNRLDLEIEKFDAHLKAEKVSKIMQEILADSKKSSRLQCLSRANIENLIDTVSDEVSSIVSKRPQFGGEFASLVSEFNQFDESLRRILKMPASGETVTTSSQVDEDFIAEVYFSAQLRNEPFGSLEQLQARLNTLCGQFASIVSDVFVLHITTSANNHSISKNFCLESKFQVIIATLSICTGLFISLAIS